MKIDFPKDFWWGAATSGPQSEGRFNKRHANVFDYWYEVEPAAFFDHDCQISRQHARNIFDKTAAGNVSNAVNIFFFH